VHALLIQRQQFKLAALRALDERTNNDGVIRGEGKQSRIKRPVMSTAECEAVARIICAFLLETPARDELPAAMRATFPIAAGMMKTVLCHITISTPLALVMRYRKGVFALRKSNDAIRSA
jgi:hypothetical protein